MSIEIPFTKDHEALLVENSKKIDRNSEKIDRNSEKIDRNSEKIDRNSEKIDRNSKKIDDAVVRLETRMDVLFEEAKGDAKAILEVVTATQRKLDEEERYRAKIDDHEHRIAALERGFQDG